MTINYNIEIEERNLNQLFYTRREDNKKWGNSFLIRFILCQYYLILIEKKNLKHFFKSFFYVCLANCLHRLFSLWKCAWELWIERRPSLGPNFYQIVAVCLAYFLAFLRWASLNLSITLRSVCFGPFIVWNKTFFITFSQKLLKQFSIFCTYFVFLRELLFYTQKCVIKKVIIHTFWSSYNIPAAFKWNYKHILLHLSEITSM